MHIFSVCLWVSGVRLDRVRGGRQKYKRNPDQTTLVPIVSVAKKPCLDCEYFPQFGLHVHTYAFEQDTSGRVGPTTETSNKHDRSRAVLSTVECRHSSYSSHKRHVLHADISATGHLLVHVIPRETNCAHVCCTLILWRAVGILV